MIPNGNYFLSMDQWEKELTSKEYYFPIQEPNNGLIFHVTASKDLDEIHAFICQRDPDNTFSYCYINEYLDPSILAWIENITVEKVNNLLRVP